MTYSEVIKQIKQWTRRDGFKRYLFIRMIARLDAISVDPDGDISCYNEYLFDAFYDLRLLRKALRLAKDVYAAKGEFCNDYFEIHTKYEASRL